MQHIVEVGILRAAEVLTAIRPFELEARIVARLKQRPTVCGIDPSRVALDGIDDRDLVAGVEEMSREMSPDKPGAASNQDLTNG
jgi:hypothetical protein